MSVIISRLGWKLNFPAPTGALVCLLAHMMHSITVEDIRYFFDPDFPVNNSVPTVNMDLEGDHIVMAQSVPSEFKFPGKQYLM